MLAGIWVVVSLAGCSQSPLDQSSLVSRIYTVSPTIVALEIEPPPVTYAHQRDYRPTDRDRIQLEGNDIWVLREGKRIGTLAGPDRKILYPIENYEQPDLPIEWLEQPDSYRLESGWLNRDAVQPIHVYRKNKFVGMAQVGTDRLVHPEHHTIYLEFPVEVEQGRSHTLHVWQGAREQDAPIAFDYHPKRSQSEAVHVSQIGFRPDDPVKLGFLSTWMGTGGEVNYAEGMPFSLIDNDSNDEVMAGVTTLRRTHNTLESLRSRTLSQVYQMDFSTVTRAGNYRLCVDGVGCSMLFPIGFDTWVEAFSLSVRGFYHQRSGIALGPPYTDYERPRPFHPDDGLQVLQSTTPLVNTRNGLNAQGTDLSNFTNLIKGQTDERVPDVWGGYFDAADWDRRIQHLDVARGLLELLELFPDRYASLSFNLPESNNDLPDLLDEALWGIDVFKRLQTTDGGIRGGIESVDHPRLGETSWQESQTVLAYAPGAWSSYVYAGVAARAARLMQTYAPTRADEYRQSALRAMSYAEEVYRSGFVETITARARAVIDAERALAALELYQLTTDLGWHSLAVDAMSQARTNPDRDRRVGKPLQNFEFVYSRLSGDRIDGALQRRLRCRLIEQADRSLEFGTSTDFGWTKLTSTAPIRRGGGLGSPQVAPLLRAYTLTGDSKYLQASILACQFSAGANPANTTFTTGLGHRSPQHPRIKDTRILGISPPPGITVFGPIDSEGFEDYFFFRRFRTLTTPALQEWPTAETYFDFYAVPVMNEFTVMTSMLNATYAWGYLAARQ